MSTPTIDYDALAEQARTPKSVDYDALAAQARAGQHDFSSLTANPKREGTYKISTQDGQTVDVPYSNVPVFQGFQGTSFASPDEAARFNKDAANDPHRPTFWNALTNPVGSGGREQGIGGGALQVGGQAIRAGLQPFAHPIDTAIGAAEMAGAAFGGNPGLAAAQIIQPMAEQYAADRAQGGNALALENLGGQALGSYEGGRVLGEVAPTAIKVAKRAAVTPVGRAVLLGKTPEGAYESALKPSTTLSPDQRAGMIQTGLENELPVSKKGLAKIGDLIDNLDQEIKNTIATDPNRPIDPNAVATRAAQARAKFANQVNAQQDLNAIASSRQQFLNEQGALPGKPAIPPQPTGLLDAQGNPIMTAGTPAVPPQPAPPMGAADAQAMKQGTYRVLKGKFGEQGSAAVEAQKALARGLKEELVTQFPELKDLNAQESRLLNLQPVLERAVNRIANHQLVGIGTPIAGATAEALTGSGSVGAAASVMKAIFDNPNVKSRLAIAISKAQKIPYSQASARVRNYSSSLGGAFLGTAGPASQANQGVQGSQE